MDKQDGASGMDGEVDEWITSEDKRREGRGREEDEGRGAEGGGKERRGEERRAGRARLGLRGQHEWGGLRERDTVVAAGMVAPLLRLH